MSPTCRTLNINSNKIRLFAVLMFENWSFIEGKTSHFFHYKCAFYIVNLNVECHEISPFSLLFYINVTDVTLDNDS